MYVSRRVRACTHEREAHLGRIDVELLTGLERELHLQTDPTVGSL
jgi:hypothetical protein